MRVFRNASGAAERADQPKPARQSVSQCKNDPPMTLGNMRANGVRTLDAWCLGGL
jgi:hypothetical protein